MKKRVYFNIPGRQRKSESFRLRVLLLFTFFLIISAARLVAQNVSSKSFKPPKFQAYSDSLKAMDYKWIFPLLGSKVYKRGFDIPFPIGIMFNTFYGVQDIDITNIAIGFKGPNGSAGPVDMSKVIKFDKVEATVLNLNIRADMYIFPFLNVYGIVGYMPHAETAVTLGAPINLTSSPEQTGWNYGIGIMGAGGVGPVWIQADYNATWANMELLQNKVFTQIVGVRVGHTFLLAHPEQNIAVWVGAMGIFLNNATYGEISLDEVFPDLTQDQINNMKNGYNTWYNDLGPVQKQVVDNIMEKLEDKLSGDPLKDVYVTYSMDKAPSTKWAGLAGVQYQFNKRWQLRVESNFISGGKRYSVLASVNYRFLGFKKKQFR